PAPRRTPALPSRLRHGVLRERGVEQHGDERAVDTRIGPPKHRLPDGHAILRVGHRLLYGRSPIVLLSAGSYCYRSVTSSTRSSSAAGTPRPSRLEVRTRNSPLAISNTSRSRPYWFVMSFSWKRTVRPSGPNTTRWRC